MNANLEKRMHPRNFTNTSIGEFELQAQRYEEILGRQGNRRSNLAAPFFGRNIGRANLTPMEMTSSNFVNFKGDKGERINPLAI